MLIANHGILQSGNKSTLPIDLFGDSIIAVGVQKKLRSTYTGNDIRIQRASDTSQQDFGFLSNNNVDDTAIKTFIEEYSGLENLVKYSEEFDNSYWTKGNVTISTNTTTDPIGGNTADKIVENTANIGHSIFGSLTFTAATYFISAYVKAAGRNYCFLRYDDASVAVVANLSTGTIAAANGTSGNRVITSIGNGWYRISFSVTATAVTSTISLIVSSDGVYANRQYLGDGTSGIFAWGIQVNLTSLKNYVKTTANPIINSNLGYILKLNGQNIGLNDAIQSTIANAPVYSSPNGINYTSSSQKLAITHTSALNVNKEITINTYLNANSFPCRLVTKCNTSGGTNNPYDFGILTGGIPYIVRADSTGGTSRALVLRPQNYSSFPTGSKKKLTVTDGTSFWKNIKTYYGGANRRSWQGCAISATKMYLITDRDENAVYPGNLENIITEFDYNGNILNTYRNVWSSGTGSSFLSLADGMIHTDGYLYVTATNYHSNSSVETIARVVVLDPANNFSQVTTYTITASGGNSSIEGISYRSGEWWICWSGTNVIKKYNSSFVYQADYTLPIHPSANNAPPSSWYQGLQWVGDTLYANLHGGQGPNGPTGITYYTSPGLDAFSYNGTAFTRLGRIKPPTTGASQGIGAYNDKWVFADRWYDNLVLCDWAGAGEGDNVLGSITFYVDDVVVGYDSCWLTNTGTNTKDVLLGARDDGSSTLSGKIHEVLLYNKSLVKNQISRL